MLKKLAMPANDKKKAESIVVSLLLTILNEEALVKKLMVSQKTDNSSSYRTGKFKGRDSIINLMCI